MFLEDLSEKHTESVLYQVTHWATEEEFFNCQQVQQIPLPHKSSH